MSSDIFANFEIVSRINNGDIVSWLFVNVIGAIILAGLDIYTFLKLFCIDAVKVDLVIEGGPSAFAVKRNTDILIAAVGASRSEERRVGKECRL